MPVKYLLTEWERNGYHDSDFYASYWCEVEQKVKMEEVGTTRCPSPTRAHINMKDENGFRYPTLEIVQKAIVWLEGVIFESLKKAEHNRVMLPTICHNTQSLRLLQDGSFKDKKNNKTIKYSAGEVGTVIWSGHFGKFYSNGYNTKGRQNLRVGLKFNDGRIVFIPMTACRLNEEPLPDEELHNRAKNLAPNCQFSKLFGAAWDSENWALQCLKSANIATVR